MAGHAQLKFVMTECSKTQIRLTRPIDVLQTSQSSIKASICVQQVLIKWPSDIDLHTFLEG